MPSKLLSKSKYLVGLQCPKYLWTLFHEPDKIPKVDEQTQHRFDEGTKIGELAKKVFPDGVDIPTDDFKVNLSKSKEKLKLRKPLFEAAFSVDNLYSRADVLEPVGKDEWDIIEVKSSTSVKDVNVHDVSFQKYCYELAGLKIRKCFLMHINNEYVRKGEVKPKELFTKEEITSLVKEATEGIKERIDALFKVISAEKCPDVKIGKECQKPYPCPLEEECWGFLPDNHIFNLYRGGKRSLELFESGVLAIKDIPNDCKLNTNQKIQCECEKTCKPHINKAEIKSFLDKLKYPLYFLDFETYSTAIPLYDGLRPYQQIPFQFSLHIQESENSKPKHYSFLAEGSGDPRKQFISKLKELLGTKGDIIVYNQTFEKTILKKLAELLPEYKGWVESIFERVVDLLEPFRKFWYYNQKQKGSASIKKVLPVLTGKSYEGMDIAEGGTASLHYLFITHGSYDGTKATEEEVKKVRADLEKYCKLDTEAMIWILDKLSGFV